MKKLLAIERIKTFNYASFRVIIMLHFVLFILVVLIVSRVDISVPGFRVKTLFMFPHIWESFTWIASWFNLLLAIVVIVLAGNEYSYNTYRQQVMNGLGRLELLQAKAWLILFIALYALGMVFISSLTIGLFNTSPLTFSVVIQNMKVLLVYFVQAIAYMSLGLLLALIIRNNAVSIIGFIFYFALIEPVIRRFFPREARSYFPVRIISRLTPVPEVLSITSQESFTDASGGSELDLAAIGLFPDQLPGWLSLLLALVYITVFITASGIILHRRRL